ncbi:MAG: spermidine synthase [Firmicutes bacterium]|nr:spermidine synthase [Bacillota bacterium]
MSPGRGAPSRRVVERCAGVSGELALVRVGRRGYEIVAAGVFLTATHCRRSERALGREALASVRELRRVLVGGLGVGHTLRAVLDDARVREVVVVELEPKVVEWAQAYLPAAARALADPRVRVTVGDLATYLRDAAAASYDAILVDTDNGPGWLVREDNARLYGPDGLASAWDALAPGGAVAYWSAAPSETLPRDMARAGFEVRTVTVPWRAGNTPDVIYIGLKGHGPEADAG